LKAVILVGGQGSRLRPLTVNRPKPMLPVGNIPFLSHVFRHLRVHGISDIVLAVQYLPAAFSDYYGDGSSLGVRLTVVGEDEPLGTAGAVKNVERYLDDETFLVFNGDILTDLDLSAMVAAHKANGAVMSISLTPVDDPTSYGVVAMDASKQISQFVEKPRLEDAPSKLINAGTYVMEPEALQYIPAGFYMFERGLFPDLLRRGRPMYGFPSEAYWLDIGTPQRYLAANHDLLVGRVSDMTSIPKSLREGGQVIGKGSRVDPSAKISGPVVLGEGCTVAAHAQIVGPAVLGDRCTVGERAIIEDAVLWEGVQVGAGAHLRRCAIGSQSVIGANTSITNEAIIGDNCVIGANNVVSSGLRLWPNVTLPDNAISF